MNCFDDGVTYSPNRLLTPSSHGMKDPCIDFLSLYFEKSLPFAAAHAERIAKQTGCCKSSLSALATTDSLSISLLTTHVAERTKASGLQAAANPLLEAATLRPVSSYEK
jgi:hypothetical protein